MRREGRTSRGENDFLDELIRETISSGAVKKKLSARGRLRTKGATVSPSGDRHSNLINWKIPQERGRNLIKGQVRRQKVEGVV